MSNIELDARVKKEKKTVKNIIVMTKEIEIVILNFVIVLNKC